jgi:hypothetical protein
VIVGTSPPPPEPWRNENPLLATLADDEGGGVSISAEALDDDVSPLIDSPPNIVVSQ